MFGPLGKEDHLVLFIMFLVEVNVVSFLAKFRYQLSDICLSKLQQEKQKILDHF